MKREVDVKTYGVRGITHVSIENLIKHRNSVLLEGYTYSKNGKRNLKECARIRKFRVALERELNIYLVDILGGITYTTEVDRIIALQLYNEALKNNGNWTDEALGKLYLGLYQVDKYFTRKQKELLGGVVLERKTYVRSKRDNKEAEGG